MSLLRTIVVPRMLRSTIADAVSRSVTGTTRALARVRKDYVKRDQVLAWAGPMILILQLITWLLLFLFAYGLLLYGTSDKDLGDALRQAGSSLFTLGFADVNTADQTIIDFIAAATGPIVIALMIGFLPTIYSSYLDREVAVNALSVPSGEPAWAPELLSRIALSGQVDQVGGLFENWTSVAARMRMSHSTYPVLLWVRSARPYRSYAVSLMSTLDAASLTLALAPSVAAPQAFRLLLQGTQTLEVLYIIASRRPIAPRIRPFTGEYDSMSTTRARLATRLSDLDRRIGAVAAATDQDAVLGMGRDAVHALHAIATKDITLPREEFDKAVELLRASGFPIDRDLDTAWENFQATRSRYEAVAYELFRTLDSPPAPWTGTRRIPTPTVYPHSALHLLQEQEPTTPNPAPPAADGDA